MITEERMRELLESAAGGYEPSDGGAERVLKAAAPAPHGRSRRWRLPKPTGLRLALSALAAAVVVVGAMAAYGGYLQAPRDMLAEVGAPAATTVPAGPDQSSTNPHLSSTTTIEASSGFASAGGAATAPSRQTVTAGGPARPAQGAMAAGEVAKVVSTGSLAVEVGRGEIGAAMDTVTTSVVGAGGFVSTSRSSSGEGRPSASVVLRVPADRFDAMVAEIATVGRVLRRDTTGRDVSGEYADVEAQLRVLTTTRGSLLEVLAGARAVSDILAVQDRLDTVQTRIEQLQGRQRLLDDQVGMATLSVALVEPGARGAAGDNRSSWGQAVDGFTHTLSGAVASSGKALAVVLLGFLALVVAVAVARWVRRTYARLVV